jgi:hypothetical protein
MEIMTILLSLFSSVVAAFLAHYLATSRIQKNELLKFQVQAYSDFLITTSRLAVARREGDTTNQNVDIAALNDAKTRIIVCGHKKVVEKMLSFWRTGATLELEHGILAYKRMVQTMRENLGYKQHDIHTLDIADAVFKLEPSTCSYKADNNI